MPKLHKELRESAKGTIHGGIVTVVGVGIVYLVLTWVAKVKR